MPGPLSFPFPRALTVAENGRRQGLHAGLQLFVAREDVILFDGAWGNAERVEAGEPRTLTPELSLPWLSAGKPLTVLAFAHLWEKGLLNPDQTVTEIIPEFRGEGREAITFLHLLTHTSGLAGMPPGWDLVRPFPAWGEILEILYRMPAKAAGPGGTSLLRAAYDPSASWFLLAEAVQRTAGEPFPAWAAREIGGPLGWSAVRLEENAETWAENEAAGRHAPLWNTALPPRSGSAVPRTPADEAGRASPVEVPPAAFDAGGGRFWPFLPGRSARGRLRELGRLYLELGRILRGHSSPLLARETLEALIAPRRVGLFDATLQHPVDFGLGFILDSKHYGSETVPYGFGNRASPLTFGHGGQQSSMAFYDPQSALSIAVAFNGAPGEPRHQQRMRAFLTALYDDIEDPGP